MTPDVPRRGEHFYSDDTQDDVDLAYSKQHWHLAQIARAAIDAAAASRDKECCVSPLCPHPINATPRADGRAEAVAWGVEVDGRIGAARASHDEATLVAGNMASALGLKVAPPVVPLYAHPPAAAPGRGEVERLAVVVMDAIDAEAPLVRSWTNALIAHDEALAGSNIAVLAEKVARAVLRAVKGV